MRSSRHLNGGASPHDPSAEHKKIVNDTVENNSTEILNNSKYVISSTVTHRSQAGLTDASTAVEYSRIGPSYETIDLLTMRKQLVAGRNVASYLGQAL